MFVVGQKLFSSKELSYEVAKVEEDEVILKNAFGQEFDLIKTTKFIDNLIGLSNMIRMSEYILTPIDYLYIDKNFYYITLRMGNSFMPLGKYLANAEKYENIPFANICSVAINLIDNFQILHYNGLAYSSVTADNIMINIRSGQTKFGGVEFIQKCGKVKLKSGVKEYVIGQTDNIVKFTDDYNAMMIMLFEIFYLSHPFKRENGEYTTYIFAGAEVDYEEYGNAFLYRQLYPEFVNELFDKYFGGLDIVTEVEMKEMIIKLRGSVIGCGVNGCRAENFYVEGRELTCWKCGEVINPVRLKIENGSGNTIVLTRTSKISQNDIFHDGVFNVFVAEVVANPKDKRMFGIKNLMANAIYFTKKDGKTVDLQPNEAAPIAEGIVINFTENVRGRILGDGIANMDMLLESGKSNAISIFRRDAEVIAFDKEEEIYE